MNMKFTKRIVAALLLLCMVLTMVSPVQLVQAAAGDASYQYVLDTDGIDVGAQYLIVSGTGSSEAALRMDPSTPWKTSLSNVTVQGGNTISAFTNDYNCQWTFSSASNGTVYSNGYYLNIDQYARYQTDRATLQCANLGNGSYRIYLYGGGNTNLQYLACESTTAGEEWKTLYYWGVSGTTTNNAVGRVYLFKRVEVDLGCSVTYNGNGNTQGQVPEGIDGLDKGSTYTLKAPTADLRKDAGDDTYLFRGWNTKPDGSGTEYQEGQIITVNEDLVLYVQWYLQTKYGVIVVTDLDGVHTDYEEIVGEDVALYIRMDAEGAPLIPLTRIDEGTYRAYVTENGTYLVYTQHDGEEPESEHGHKVVVYNQGGQTELLNYSVSYDTNGGEWQEGQDPGKTNYHANEHVQATENIPVREGYKFLGWKDQLGNPIPAGGHVADAIGQTYTLTAQWVELINLNIQVTMKHGQLKDHDEDVMITLLRVENEVNVPVQELLLNSTHISYKHDEETNVTTYEFAFADLEQGLYRISAAKSHYTVKITDNDLQDRQIYIDLTYAPEVFDLDFQVKVEATEETEHLMPQAVNVRVTYWNGEAWKVISQQSGDAAPTTVFIGEDGTGEGFFPVWKDWPEEEKIPYHYRVDVTSFVMPDGSVIRATGENYTIYTPNGSGLYTATVSVAQDDDGGSGSQPAYPEKSDLDGVYYDDSENEQNGIPVVTVKITPFTVKFQAGEGMLDGQQEVVLSGQYGYPDLHKYVPVPKEANNTFSGWFYEDGTPAKNLAGTYLTGDVVYVAKYGMPATVAGTVTVFGTYDDNGEQVTIHEIDRLQKVLVVLQKNINGIINDVDSQIVTIQYAGGEGTDGTGTYSFQVPNDGTDYWVNVLTLNYIVEYNNNGDNVFDEEENDALIVNGLATVDLELLMFPQAYNQWCEVDAGRIEEKLRPTGAEVQILYRDLGEGYSYQVIAQHLTDQTKGLKVVLDETAIGTGFEDIWKYHNNGTLYEYQLQLRTVYGNVEGAYLPEGTLYSEASPFTVQYGLPLHWEEGGEAKFLKATLIPKEYEIIFDMNLDGASDTIRGMEAFRRDAADGTEYYSYTHTWSYSDQITAFPYREGWVFNGWESDSQSVSVTDHGTISVGAATAETVTLKASWTPLKGRDYTVRYLELNTDKVLHGALAVTDVVVDKVVAADAMLPLEGYVYAGAMVHGTYYDKTENPVLVITDNPNENVLTIYYLPDGSDGYTEQVESNLRLNKTATLEDDGTYTIQLENYTLDNPITTYIRQNTPLDIVLVLDQSGSIIQSGYLDDLQLAVNNFITLIANHGRTHEVDHRIAVVGYAGDEDEAPTSTNTNDYPIAGGTTSTWVNTGVFDSNGDFHPYPVTGFNYTQFNGNPQVNGTYYTYSDGEYLLLTYHKEYRHLLTEAEARIASWEGQQVYGYINSEFVELTRNTSGLWLYGDRQLYSLPEFFTLHTDVWTHRKGLEYRQIHAYGTGDSYRCTDGHGALYTRTESRNAQPQLSIYKDAMIPVSVGANGSGGVNPGLTKATSHLGSNGGTFVQYGIEMANRVFAANPLDPEEGRVRIMVTFTDGLPGIGTFDETVANLAIDKAYTTKNDHKAYSYTVGLYPHTEVGEFDDQAFFMNGLSSNYTKAKSMSDVRSSEDYVVAADGTNLAAGGPYYVLVNGQYLQLEYKSSYSFWQGTRYGWAYTRNGSTTYVTGPDSNNNYNQYVTNGKVGNYTIYRKNPIGYKPADGEGYYATTSSTDELIEYFAEIVKEITTKVQQEIILDNDTIMRDIMGQGLELTAGTVITASIQAGEYNSNTKEIDWVVNEKGEPVLKELVSLTIGENGNSKATDEETGVSILVYNLGAENTTDPVGANYSPHTVDITGYNYAGWYIDGEEKTSGYKMVVKITRVEARDNVVWGRSMTTNYETSGMWLPEKDGKRELLLPFEQPSTIFVERAYVLDYGKEFTLSGWYFDDEGENKAEAKHLDFVVEDGMNWFDTSAPNKENSETGKYGNTRYGNVKLENGEITYTPVTMSWGGYDQFYVFGNTWRNTVVSQDANENGNLWNKVTVIPANNVYYEDSFITDTENGVNKVNGFVFSENNWLVETSNGAGSNKEQPEHQEKTPYGDVHGWTDDLADDKGYSDGSAHVTGTNGEIGAEATFTFTGTGVDVYTRTNADSGLIFAFLTEVGDNGDGVTTQQTQIIDNLAVSGDYYQIPTVSFMGLPYGTYQVDLVATAVNTATENMRYEYALDGIRVYNPLGSSQIAANDVVKDAYGKEQNAVFTEIRDILLDYNDFMIGTSADTTTGLGAVFIDWVQDWQGGEGDTVGEGVPTYQVGTFETYGPKNEVDTSVIILRNSYS